MDNKEYSKLVKECTPKENLFKNIVISFIIGGFIGAKLLNKFSDLVLKVVFIVFLIYVSIKLII